MCPNYFVTKLNNKILLPRNNCWKLPMLLNCLHLFKLPDNPGQPIPMSGVLNPKKMCHKRPELVYFSIALLAVKWSFWWPNPTLTLKTWPDSVLLASDQQGLDQIELWKPTALPGSSLGKDWRGRLVTTWVWPLVTLFFKHEKGKVTFKMCTSMYKGYIYLHIYILKMYHSTVYHRV